MGIVADDDDVMKTTALVLGMRATKMPMWCCCFF